MFLKKTGQEHRAIVVSDSYQQVSLNKDNYAAQTGLSIAYAVESFADAVSLAGANSTTIIVEKAVSISGDLTVPANVALHVRKGGSFSVAATKTLTINCAQLLTDGQGTGVFGGSGTTTINAATKIDGFPQNLQKGIVDLEVSFEAGEQTTHTLYFPFKVTINKIRAFVTKALAATDDGTITAKNNAGTGMTNGAITLTASSAVATEGSASPSANNVIDIDEKLQLTVAKTTAGGHARVTVEYTRS